MTFSDGRHDGCIFLCVMAVIAAVLALFAYGILTQPAHAAEPAAPASSCQPPAQTWATLVACKTMTAAAQSGQETTAPTVTASPTFTAVPTLRPTEVQPTPPPLLIDSDGNPWACNQQASWTAVSDGRRWFVLDCVRPPVPATPTRIPTVTALP